MIEEAAVNLPDVGAVVCYSDTLWVYRFHLPWMVMPKPGPLFASFMVKTPLDGTIVSATSNSTCSTSFRFEESLPFSRIELIS